MSAVKLNCKVNWVLPKVESVCKITQELLAWLSLDWCLSLFCGWATVLFCFFCWSLMGKLTICYIAFPCYGIRETKEIHTQKKIVGQSDKKACIYKDTETRSKNKNRGRHKETKGDRDKKIPNNWGSWQSHNYHTSVLKMTPYHFVLFSSLEHCHKVCPASRNKTSTEIFCIDKEHWRGPDIRHNRSPWPLEST